MNYITELLAALPFHGNVLMQIDIREDRSIDTAAIARDKVTRRLVAVFNPDFMDMLERKAKWFVAAHEAEHVARFHAHRRKDRDPHIWNIACDMLINATLLRYGLELPGNTMVFSEVDANDRNKMNELRSASHASGAMLIPCATQAALSRYSEEQLYDMLLPHNEHLMGGVATLDDHSQMDADAEEKDVIADAVAIAAAIQATPLDMRGTVPGEAVRMVEQVKSYRSTFDWRRKMARFLGSGAQNEDFTYSRPNLQAMARDDTILLPGMVRYGVTCVAVVIDTSGSMGQADLVKALGELSAMLRQTKPEKVVLIEADADVCMVQTIHSKDLASWIPPDEVHGGGGTTFGPALAEAMRHDPDMIVYFTDGYGDDPDPVPVPTLWALIGGAACSASWGEVTTIG